MKRPRPPRPAAQREAAAAPLATDAARGVLGLFPHPDDEAYAAGGLLAHCAARGASVALLCATRGEHGADRSGAAASGPALAARRSRELAASCRALGIAPPRILDLPDGGLAAVESAVLVATLREHLQRARPHLVVTLGGDGVYGNLDHLAWTAAVAAAVYALAAPPRVLHAVFPRRLFAPLWRALHRRRGAPLVAAIDPQALGVEATAVDLRLDIRPLRARKLAAIAAHVSQLADGDPHTLLFPGVVEHLLDEEWYVVADGPALPAGAVDPFAGL